MSKALKYALSFGTVLASVALKMQFPAHFAGTFPTWSASPSSSEWASRSARRLVC
jgi:hypothetical protein